MTTVFEEHVIEDSMTQVGDQIIGRDGSLVRVKRPREVTHGDFGTGTVSGVRRRGFVSKDHFIHSLPGGYDFAPIPQDFRPERTSETSETGEISETRARR